MDRLQQLIKKYDNTKNQNEKEILAVWIINTMLLEMKSERQTVSVA